MFMPWMEQAVARILRWSRHLLSSTINLNLYENRFSYIKSMQMYTGRYVIQIFMAENISVQVLLRHACSIFEELKSNKD